MRYTIAADTDIGTVKKTNQDSVLLKHACYGDEEVLLAIICDGMGGLAKGELASATVVRTFSDWFDHELPYELRQVDFAVIASKWELLLKELNVQIQEYSVANHLEMGTTFSGMLIIGNRYLIVHVGDSRIYEITEDIKQLTTDHSFVDREVRLGRMTEEEARWDKRRNLLLQCIGASARIEPEVLFGSIHSGIYLLCSDGLRHEITNQELLQTFHSCILCDKVAMRQTARNTIDCVKTRGERDNISVVLIKAERKEGFR